LAGFLAGSGLGGALTGISALLGMMMPGLTFTIVELMVAIAAVVGSVLAWRLNSAADTWVRVVATLGVIVATVLLGAATVPIQLFGLPGLLGLMLTELVVSLLASQWARKLARGFHVPASGSPTSA
jgi:hypothetical protein